MELHLELGGEGIQGSWSGGCAGGLTSTENLLQLQRQGAQWDFTPGTWALLDKKKPSHSYRCPGAQSRESPHTESGRAHPAGHVSGSSEDVHVREVGGHLRTLRSLYLKVCPDSPISWSLWFVPRSMSLQYRFFCLFVFGFWGLTAISCIMASILTGD